MPNASHDVAPATFLLTGFEPFAEHAVNPSALAAHAVAERLAGGPAEPFASRADPPAPPRIIALTLPVDHHRARAGLLEALETHRPAACLAMGLTGGRQFRFEQRARKPDQFAGLDGPPELAGNWPWGDIELAARSAGMDFLHSDEAGRFVCESTYWVLLDFAARRGFPRRAGFLHVPAADDDCPVERTIQCVEAIVRASLALVTERR